MDIARLGTGPPKTDDKQRKKAVVAACIGNFIEYYDFVVYGYFATVIAELFFPAGDAIAGLLLTFAAFAVSYAARPLGSLIFGHIGDRYGRRAPLTVAILLIALCTTTIGLLPTYQSIGLAAPIILTLARVLQGISVGGEYGGALAFISEYAPKNRRSFYTGWQTFTIGVALLTGAGVAALITTTLSPEDVQSWGWRLPFLAGLPLGFVGLYMRLKLEDTPQFSKLKEQLTTEKVPVWSSMRREWKSFLLAMGTITTPALCIYIYFIYSPTFLQAVLDYDVGQAQLMNMISLVFYCMLIPVFAYVGDRVGRRPLLIAGALGVALVTYPGFEMLRGGSVLLATAGLCIMALAFAPISAVSLASIAEVFPTTFRYTGTSLSLNIPVTLFGGTAPLAATALIGATGSPLAPAIIVIAGGLVSFVAAWFIPETSDKDLRVTSDDQLAR